MKKVVFLLTAGLVVGGALTGAAEPLKTLQTGETNEQRAARIQWWRQARFGMFIHWGPVSLKETEISWSRANSNPKCPNNGPIPVEVYDNLYRRFHPVKFDARQWVALAREAGMKYMILTAKHCDGFLLWDSKVDDYNIMHTPFQRDVCGELVKAARREDMRIGWYFSPMDWRDADFRTDRNAAFLERMQGELGELLTNYGPIDILWFDHDGGEAMYDQANTYALVKQLQPHIIINNRLDLGVGNSNRQILSPFADYTTPEQIVGGYDDQTPWESCMTVSQRSQWSWGGPQDGVKSFETCLNMLIRCAGGDGNLLLNVGPTPSGEIAPEQADILRKMGAWLAKYGESIYGTRGGPFRPGRYGASTRKGKTIYLHIQRWADNVLTLPGIPTRIESGTVLTGGQVTVKQSDETIEISVPVADRDPIDTIVALKLDRQALEIAPVEAPAERPSLTTGRKAKASNVYQNNTQYSADKAVDGNLETRWASDAGVKSAWLEIDLGRPTVIGRAVIEQAYPELQRCRQYAIEYWQDGHWTACYRGENLGASVAVSFAPVTAQRVRLNIAEATDGPTLWEFSLFPPAADQRKNELYSQ
ncbi:MAG: alpha-L-fucosidase [Sedimentisphaerales bacterium]|nr:alpha-L-fucosidase [Sedimentisphaerales bacterium]